MTKPLVRRATIAYRRATPEQLAAGRHWYMQANAIAHAQALRHGVPITVAAGVISALSPRLGWGPNTAIAERLLASRGTLDAGAMGRSLAHARAIYEGRDPDRILRGQKTNAFYHAILSCGQSPVSVIDRHAWDMLTNQRGADGPNITQYRAADAAMRRAAQILGVGVHEVQATTWLVQRAKYWRPGAFDINERPEEGEHGDLA